MAGISTSSYFGNGKVQGVPQVASDFDKFADHASPRFAIGYKIEDSDGAVYRYSHFGTAISGPGTLLSQDLSESSLGDSDNVIVASASCTVTTDGTVGSRYLEVTAGHSGTPITANQFAGGKFITTDDTGEGYTYDIVGNTANATEGSTTRIQLKQKLQAAVTSDTDFIIVGNKYANLEIATSATDNFLAGVSTRAQTVDRFGWVQTKGVCGILMSGTESAGDAIQLSMEISGAVVGVADPQSSTENQIIGSCIVAADDTGYGAYYINLE